MKMNESLNRRVRNISSCWVDRLSDVLHVYMRKLFDKSSTNRILLYVYTRCGATVQYIKRQQWHTTKGLLHNPTTRKKYLSLLSHFVGPFLRRSIYFYIGIPTYSATLLSFFLPVSTPIQSFSLLDCQRQRSRVIMRRFFHARE